MTLTTADEDKYLSLLSIAHYAVAVPVFLVGCLPIFHLVVGIGIVSGAFFVESSPVGEALPVGEMVGAFGAFFIAVAATIIAVFWSLAVALIVAGRSLARRQRHTFCLVVAFLSSMFAPLGTILALFTIVLLVQPSVRARFDEGDPLAAPPVGA